MTAVTASAHRPAIAARGVWDIDASHSTVGFVARHLMVTKVRGRFTDVRGSVTIAEDPAASSAEVEIATASLDTGNADRDAHVRDGDFLDVEAFPTMTWRSTGVRPDGDGWLVDGELTVKGVTRPVTLAVEFEGTAKDPWGGERAAFSAKSEIDREDFGLTWNVTLDSGGVLVGKKIKLELDVQLVRKAA